MQSLGYDVSDNDYALLVHALTHAESYILLYCNIDVIPEALRHVLVDMACGEFLQDMKSTGRLEGYNIDLTSKEITLGDTKVVFSVGSGSSTPEQRLDAVIDKLLNGWRNELVAYRRLIW